MDSNHIAFASLVALALAQLSPSLPLHVARAKAAESIPRVASEDALPRRPFAGDPVVIVVVTTGLHRLADLAPTARTILGLPRGPSSASSARAGAPLSDLFRGAED
jgi:hypothetical protein